MFMLNASLNKTALKELVECETKKKKQQAMINTVRYGQ